MLFVFVGEFIEEIISPIPSFVVLIPAGAAAQVQAWGWWYIAVLAVCGAAGRLVASVLLYTIADKGEHILFGRRRSFFGITHAKLNRYGKELGASRRSWVGLFLLNAVPVVPTSLLSLSCGFLKVRLGLFASATFLGTIISAATYLALGYAGVEVISRIDNQGAILPLLSLVLAMSIIWWVVHGLRAKKQRGR